MAATDKDSIAAPGKTLSVADAVAIIMGVVIGAGIFKTPSMVAANTGNENVMLLLWIAGGAISLVGALCYAELASTYPNAGGDYHYLVRAFGPAPGFLFAWARMTVIQSGSIAMLAFLIGDYASEAIPLGSYSSSWYAAATIILLTLVNLLGIRQGGWVQKAFVATIIIGFLLMFLMALTLSQPHTQVETTHGGSIGKAMIFILLTYGGWNEAAYLSAELRGARASMVKVLLLSITAITTVYVAANIIFVKILGLAEMSSSEAVAADVMRKGIGKEGVYFISILVALAALSTINGSMITGARTSYALGRDFKLFRFLGEWKTVRETPANALFVQAAISLVLVAIGTGSRNGFNMMVEYTAPVFWFFFLLVGLSLFLLRWKEPQRERPFSVPLYPLTPLAFCAVCLFMLWSSIAYTGKGGLFGIAVLLTGVPLLLLKRKNPYVKESI